MTIGYSDPKALESVWIALPDPNYNGKCLPKVRSAQFGYPDMNLMTNKLGCTHHAFEQYYHNSVVKELQAKIAQLEGTK